MYRVSRAYRFIGIELINACIPLIPAWAGKYETTAAAQDETGAIMQIGADVESTR